MSENTLAELDWLVEAAKSSFVHELAQAVPVRGRGPGRKRDFPPIVGVLYILLAGGVAGSHRSAVLLMGSKKIWWHVRHAVHQKHGITLRRKPPERWHLEGWRITLAKHVDLLCERARDIAIREAIEYGCFNPEGTSPTNLLRSDALHADGKVVKGIFNRKVAERRKARGESLDFGWHTQGGEDSNDKVSGPKFVLLAVRALESRNAHFLLDVAYQPSEKGNGGEAGTAVQQIFETQRVVAKHGGRVNTVCYDGAFRGKHIDALMKQDLVVLSPVHKRIAGRSALEIVKDCPCRSKHVLVAVNGSVHEETLLVDGQKHSSPCPIRRLRKRQDVGAHRWYLEVELSCGATRRVRVDATEEDKSAGFNRAERVRQHAPDSPAFKDCYGWRSESESWNNTLDRTLYGGRMIAHARDKQLLTILGFMLARNVLATHAIRRARLRSTA